MEQILRTLGLYDIVAFLLPGCVVVGAGAIALNAYLRSQQRPSRAPTSVTFFVASYIVGALLQGVVSPERDWWFYSSAARPIQTAYANTSVNHDTLRSDLAAAATRAFGAVSERDVFLLAEAYNRVHDLNSFADVMQARYAFFRGLSAALFFAFVAFAAASFWNWRARDVVTAEDVTIVGPRGFSRILLFGGSTQERQGRERMFFQTLALTLLCVVGVGVAYIRATDFDRYYTDNVYRVFYVHFREAEATAARQATASAPATQPAPTPLKEK